MALRRDSPSNISTLHVIVLFLCSYLAILAQCHASFDTSYVHDYDTSPEREIVRRALRPKDKKPKDPKPYIPEQAEPPLTTSTPSPSTSIKPTYSLLPTMSTKPSYTPTSVPSITSGPSQKPSSTPSISTEPSTTPSIVPTTYPTERPSTQPTTNGTTSSIPSSVPTITPSNSPTTESTGWWHIVWNNRATETPKYELVNDTISNDFDENSTWSEGSHEEFSSRSTSDSTSSESIGSPSPTPTIWGHVTSGSNLNGSNSQVMEDKLSTNNDATRLGARQSETNTTHLSTGAIAGFAVAMGAVIFVLVNILIRVCPNS